MKASMSDIEDDSDDESDDESRSGGNERKLSLILLMTLLAVLSVARMAVPMTRSVRSNATSGGNVRTVGATTARRPAASSFHFNFNHTSPASSSSSSSDQEEPLSPASLPIYLLRSPTNETARTTWGTLAREWNRTTQYDHLFELATSVPYLPASPTMLLFRRPVVMIHCGPKTGSTTLRKACKANLKRTCGMNHTKGHKKQDREPEGYMDESKLYPLIRRCADTTHFCAKEVDMPPSFDDVPPFEDVLFVHMFPFRNYDEWAASALKQQYDRGGERGCNKTREKLEECKHNHMEIDFRKYGKTELARFKEGAVKRMVAQRGEDHVFLLYHHRELNDVLERLSETYDVPLLPGSDGKGKEKRPEGTCDAKLLQMFHDCFSSKLMDLT